MRKGGRRKKKKTRRDEREEDETDGVSTLNGAECVRAQLV